MSSADFDPQSGLEPAVTHAGNPAPRSGISRTFLWLVPLLLAACVAFFAVPEILKQIYFAEEEAKVRNKPNLVGTNTSAVPPPGVSTDPYGGRGGAAPNDGAPNDGAPKQDDSAEKKDSAETKEDK
jgi:hypothetical protein